MGSVEALINILEDADIKIKHARVGKITRKDIVEAKTAVDNEWKYGVVLGFNVQITDDARQESEDQKVPIIWSNIVYKVLDQYQEWIKETEDKMKKEALEKFPWPGKIKLLPGCCFRVSKPAIFGVEILGGRIKREYRLMDKKGNIVGSVREMQHEKEKIEEGTKGMQLALSCDDIYYGKDACEHDMLYVFMTDEQVAAWMDRLSMLSEDEKEILEEIKRAKKTRK